MTWCYILRCSDDSYYVGSTIHLEQRVSEHNSPDRGASYTRRRRPVTLVWAAQFLSTREAFDYEKRVQGWSRRKREALIRGDFEALPALSRRIGVQRRSEEG